MTVGDRSTLAPSGEIKHDQAVPFLPGKHNEPHRQPQTGSNAEHSRLITPASLSQHASHSYQPGGLFSGRAVKGLGVFYQLGWRTGDSNSVIKRFFFHVFLYSMWLHNS